MRNRSGLALPLLFEWKVARSGYQWVNHKDGRFLCAAALQPDWRDTLDQYETRYRPFERTALFQEFADLEPTEKGILDFANRFGLLDTGGNLEFDTQWGTALVRGETLELWKAEIRNLNFTVRLWNVVSAGASQVLTSLRTELGKLEVPLAVRRQFHFDDDDPAMATLSAIQRITDARLQAHTQPRLFFQENVPRLEVVLTPVNLIGALWLQFALAVNGLKSFTKCGQCGIPFELSCDPRTGKRSDARFCGVRCRVGHYRGRIEQARRLKNTGLSAKEIARRLNTAERTVRGWLRARRAGSKEL